uniref:Uncharacterized protein n=1 Tax=Triticum urartu TaxID=4572 RepID=A0A8R7UVL9_TRIUA
MPVSSPLLVPPPSPSPSSVPCSSPTLA